MQHSCPTWVSLPSFSAQRAEKAVVLPRQAEVLHAELAMRRQQRVQLQARFGRQQPLQLQHHLGCVQGWVSGLGSRVGTGEPSEAALQLQPPRLRALLDLLLHGAGGDVAVGVVQQRNQQVQQKQIVNH